MMKKPRELWSTPVDVANSPLKGNAAKMKKASEVEVIAMIMAELGLSSLDAKKVDGWWNVVCTEDRAHYRKIARAFLRALRGGR